MINPWEEDPYMSQHGAGAARTEFSRRHPSENGEKWVDDSNTEIHICNQKSFEEEAHASEISVLAAAHIKRN
jgi:hypothetical protein